LNEDVIVRVLTSPKRDLQVARQTQESPGVLASVDHATLLLDDGDILLNLHLYRCKSQLVEPTARNVLVAQDVGGEVADPVIAIFERRLENHRRQDVLARVQRSQAGGLDRVLVDRSSRHVEERGRRSKASRASLHEGI